MMRTCGSGRDLLWFKEHGFQPTGFEASPALAHLAEDHSGCPVIVWDFSSYDFSSHAFNALVFVGSLVHQSKNNLQSVLAATLRALVPGGHILITMKEGTGTLSTSAVEILSRSFCLIWVFSIPRLFIVVVFITGKRLW